MIPREETAANCRRAAALWVHNTNRDPDGFFAVLAEVKTSDDMVTLLLGIFELFENLVGLVHNDVGVDLVRQVVAGLANIENGAAE